MGNAIRDGVGGVITIAIIFVLVRPGSNGPGFVGAVGDSFSKVLTSATGGGGWWAPGGQGGARPA
jgi:hypothetical protein